MISRRNNIHRLIEPIRRMLRVLFEPESERAFPTTAALVRPLTPAARFSLLAVVEYADAGGFRRPAEVSAALASTAPVGTSWVRNMQRAARGHEPSLIVVLRGPDAAALSVRELCLALRRLLPAEARAFEAQWESAELARQEELFWQG